LTCQCEIERNGAPIVAYRVQRVKELIVQRKTILQPEEKSQLHFIVKFMQLKNLPKNMEPKILEFDQGAIL
jgi:hypothetical protein